MPNPSATPRSRPELRSTDAATILTQGLSAIRDGAMSFEQLLDEATRLREAMASAAATTTLPDDVDRGFVDELALRLVDPR